MPSDPRPQLRIAYLTEDTELSGGVRITLAQADTMIDRGHSVSIVTKGLPLRWRRSSAEWIHVDDFRQIDPDEYDFIVGTFWTTIPVAYELAGDRAVHLCQGYEGSFTAYQDIKEQIDDAYRYPIPKIVVAPSLVPICEQFGSDVIHVGQLVDEEFYRSEAADENDPLRVLLVGASQIDFKGIDVGYGAVAHARHRGAKFHLVRVSPWRASSHEPTTEPDDEFHVSLDAPAMCKLVHSCDIFLGPSRSQEGFGLPAAEAMASMIPTVLTRIPSFVSFHESDDYALWASENDPEELGQMLLEAIESRSTRRRLSKRGREVAEQFRAIHMGEKLEEFFFDRHQKLAGRPKARDRSSMI